MSGSFLFLLRMTYAHASRRDNALSDLINSAHEIIISYHALRSTDKIINYILSHVSKIEFSDLPDIF